jgi:hypothetical protein
VSVCVAAHRRHREAGRQFNVPTHAYALSIPSHPLTHSLTPFRLAMFGIQLPELRAGAGLEGIASLDKLRFANGQRATADIRMEMQGVMQDNAAVYRTHESLSLGKTLIDQTVQSFADVKVCVCI